jgi:PIN domain nuclease of toxin-antitoxin system
MRLLIDTHAILWFQLSDSRLSNTAKTLIADPNNQCFISIASLWEMAIKFSSKKEKLKFEIGFENFPDYLVNNQFDILQVIPEHLNNYVTLDHHHGDPFDRMLIAQAITEDLILISKDKEFKSYPVNIIW